MVRTALMPAGGSPDRAGGVAAPGAAHERELERVRRTLAMINACVRAIVRAVDEAALTNAICQLAVEHGGYRLAWVGIAAPEPGRRVVPVAQAGPAVAYLDRIEVSWADDAYGRGPTGTAMRTGQPQVVHDLQTDPNCGPWREPARVHALASIVALPLQHDGIPLGALTIYADRVDAFDAAELSLLCELADNLAFGLVALRRRLERDAALRALADKSALLARAEAVSHLGSWRVELGSGRLVCSDEIYAIVGVAPADFVHDIRANLARLVHPEDRAATTALIAAALADGVPRPVTCRLLRPDGTIRWVHAAGEAVRDDAGHVVALTGYLLDITERRRIEDGLRQTSMAVEQSPVAIEVTDTEGTIEYVNPWFTRVTGYAAHEVIGQHARILKSGLTPPERYVELWATIRAGQVWEGEMQNRRKDGGLFWERATISPLRNAAGVITHYVAVKEDITARKAAEAAQALLQAELAQAQKLESVGRLAGGVAHDFNNMLGAILGLTELVMLDLGPGHPSHGDLLDIRSAAQRSAELTRQLLSFARRHPIRPQVVDLNDAVAGMLKLLRRLIGEDIELAWRPGAALWPVEVDPSQIDQILANLAVNARDAIAGVGRLTLATANVEVDAARLAPHPAARPGPYVQLTVADTGCGMDADVLAHMFEPFFTTKEPGKGTGLGAATVYGVVTQNAGFIEVQSTPGQGTTFAIYLPRTTRIATADAAATQRPIGGAETVLVVEDEQVVLALTQAMLERLGYAVLAAHSGAEALAIAHDHPAPIDLLVTDVVMPDLNGRELYAALATARPGLGVLYVSGYSADVLAPRGVIPSDVQFLQKPFAFADLAARVRAALAAAAG